jgi:hypothetical protein
VRMISRGKKKTTANAVERFSVVFCASSHPSLGLVTNATSGYSRLPKRHCCLAARTNGENGRLKDGSQAPPRREV